MGIYALTDATYQAFEGAKLLPFKQIRDFRYFRTPKFEIYCDFRERWVITPLILKYLVIINVLQLKNPPFKSRSNCRHLEPSIDCSISRQCP